MPSYDEVKDFIITTEASAIKNLTSESFTFSSAATAVGAASYVLRQFTVPLSTDTRFYQLYYELSLDSGKWFDVADVSPYQQSGIRGVQVVVSKNATDLTLNLYLIDQSGAGTSFGDITINVTRRDFVDEV